MNLQIYHGLVQRHINKITVESAASINFQRTIVGYTIDVPNDIIQFTTGLAITSLTMSLITVVQYYFKRVEYLQETDMSAEILDKAFDDVQQDKT